MDIHETTHLPVSFNPSMTGQVAIAIAIAALVSVGTLALLYSGMPIFGPINDFTNAINGLLIALLVWQFHAMLRDNTLRLAILLLLVAGVGTLAIVINSVLVAFGAMHWMTGALYTAVGYGLLGIWFFGLLRLLGPQPFLTPRLVRLGTIAAIAMLFGLLAGPALVTRVSLTDNPLVGVVYVGAAAGWLLFPVWCWLVGRMLLQ
jgi:hypothetical protein